MSAKPVNKKSDRKSKIVEKDDSLAHPHHPDLPSHPLPPPGQEGVAPHPETMTPTAPPPTEKN